MVFATRDPHTAQPELSPCLRGTSNEVAEGVLLRTLSIACCSGVIKAYSASSTPLLFQLEEIDKSCFSQPARHHLRRCNSRPIAASLVEYWLLH